MLQIESLGLISIRTREGEVEKGSNGKANLLITGATSAQRQAGCCEILSKLRAYEMRVEITILPSLSL